MKHHWIALAPCTISLSFAGVITGSSQTASVTKPSDTENSLWRLERSYWRYVEDNNLQDYRNLWHRDFLGWPLVSPAPVHKDHITDWITSQTSKGLSLRMEELKPAAIQVTGNIGVICYWLTYRWVDESGNGETYTIRVTHTWIKDGKDWRIIGGMSMPETMLPKE